MSESSYLSVTIKDQTSNGHKKGESDDNPIEIPNVKASQFRNLLFVLLGTPANPEYLSLLTEANQVDGNVQNRLASYLDVALLSTIFGMDGLGAWAYSQLGIALRSSGPLANEKWEKDVLVQALTCADIMPGSTRSLWHDTLAFIYLVLSASVDALLTSKKRASSNLETCTHI
ncbi:hypothetical protein FRC07_004652 [Ceratobasidium sp. 392]|nr:hypothetical protein FRC07_004652 [Ceratobasidium sp. 392]